jgi:predicted pyridoxine 5'-phosphate oxidase superfamily flavin-nucleotide-binding protein
MKTKYLFLFILGILISSCDKDFEEVNTNPIVASSLDPAYLLANAQYSAMLYTVQYQDAIAQHVITPFGSTLEGGQHNIWYEPGDASSVFGDMYTGSIKLLVDVIDKTRDLPNRSNLYNMARIWKAYCFQVVVDTYGDVPYFEAGQAFINNITLPKYDKDEVIYDDLLKELTEATAALTEGQAPERNELFYQGNVAQWKKLGNSLLLRVAMRYTKVDPAKAQQYVAIAVNPANGGLMSSNADNAKVVASVAWPTPTANTWNGSERANFYIAEPFINQLKSTNDPRLRVIAVKYQFPFNPLATAGTANTNPADQIGMPVGYNDATIVTAPNYPGKTGAAWNYSQINRSTLAKSDATYFFVTYSQTMLLLAEAVHRGWATGNVAEIYNAAVRGHMGQMEQFDPSAAISVAEMDAYMAANPFNPAQALEQINTQYWISTFMNGQEAWSNFRRTGLPALTPNPYPGADPVVAGGFVRRLQFQNSEKTTNAENYEAAIASFGPDNMATRVFWDI